MRDDLFLEEARRWRRKAEECLTASNETENLIAKMSFRHMAESYDRSANGLEERAAELPGIEAKTA
jgi:hypothetical protein